MENNMFRSNRTLRYKKKWKERKSKFKIRCLNRTYYRMVLNDSMRQQIGDIDLGISINNMVN